MTNRLTAALVLMIFSPWAYAAEAVPWGWYLLASMGLALFAAIILSVRNKNAQGRAAKILLAGLYFWGLTFAAMMLIALIYHFTQ